MQQGPRELNQQFNQHLINQQVQAYQQPASKPVTSSMHSPFSAYGTGIRKQVFELIVQQATTGAEWKESFTNQMRLNNIMPREIEQEVARRRIAAQPQSLQHAWLEHKSRLNALKHTEQSPCPCNACLAEVLKAREFKYDPSRRA